MNKQVKLEMAALFHCVRPQEVDIHYNDELASCSYSTNTCSPCKQPGPPLKASTSPHAFTDHLHLRNLSSANRRTPTASSAPAQQRPLSSPVLRWCAVTPNATHPHRSTPGSIGLDLAAAAPITILPVRWLRFPQTFLCAFSPTTTDA